jgi:hypothetical protein
VRVQRTDDCHPQKYGYYDDADALAIDDERAVYLHRTAVGDNGEALSRLDVQ